MYKYNFSNQSGLKPMRFNSVNTTQLMAPNSIFKGGNNISKNRIIKTKNFKNVPTMDNGKAFPMKNVYPRKPNENRRVAGNSSEFIANLCRGKPTANGISRGNLIYPLCCGDCASTSQTTNYNLLGAFGSQAQNNPYISNDFCADYASNSGKPMLVPRFKKDGPQYSSCCC
jgi:hypothetical protein